MTQSSRVYFEIFLEKLDYMLISETRMVDDAQKRASTTTHPVENLKTTTNYFLSLILAK